MHHHRLILTALLFLAGVASPGALPMSPLPGEEGAGPAAPARKDSLGDPLPPGAVARFGTWRLRTPYPNHSAGGLLFTPDGERLVTAAWVGEDEDPGRAVQVWDVATGALVAAFGEQEGGVISLALTGDGKLLATGGKDGSVDIWDLPTRKRLRRVRDEGWESVRAKLAFSPDGNSLIRAGLGVQIWDARSGKLLRQYKPPHPVQDIAVAPDGKTLAVSAYSLGTRVEAVAVLEMATGRHLYTVPAGWDAAVAYAPDGSTFAAVGSDGLLRVHDVGSGKVLQEWRAWRALSANARHRPLAYAPGGQVLATSDHEYPEAPVTLWAARSGRMLFRLPTYYGLEYLAFSPDGKLLAGWDGYRVSLLNTLTGKPHLAFPGHKALVNSVAAFADGDRFASAGGGRVLVWDHRKPAPVAAYLPAGRDPDAISCLGSDLLTFFDRRSGTVSVYHRTSQEPVAVYRTKAILFSTCLSPDGKLLACGDNNATVHFYTPGKEQAVRRLSIPHDGKPYLFCNALAYSLDGHRLAVACSDGTLRLCDVDKLGWVETLDGGERLTPDGFMAPLTAVAYDPTGLLLAARGEGKLIFWDAATSQLVRRVDLDEGRPHQSAVSFSPDGRYLASCEGGEDATLWEVRSGEVVGRLRGHEAAVIGVRFLAGGRQLVTGSHDHTLLLWDRSLLHPGDAGGGLEGAWDDLGGSAARSHAAIWRLVRTPGAEAYLAKRLTASPRPGGEVKAEQVNRWIADLNGGTAAERASAREHLLASLDYAEGAILAAVRKATAPGTRSILKPFLAEVFRRRQAATRLRADRVLAVLEYLGTAEAKKALRGVAAGAAEHWLTQEAKATLQRLDNQAAPGR